VPTFFAFNKPSRHRLTILIKEILETSLSNPKQDAVLIMDAVILLLTALATVFILLLFATFGDYQPVALFSFYDD
jgi:hypothetical protein